MTINKERLKRPTAAEKLANSEKTLAIVAMGNSMRDYLYHNYEKKRDGNIADEVWTINSCAFVLKSDMVIMMDDMYGLLERGDEHNRDNYVARIKKELSDTPILTSREYPDFPSTIQYPIAEIMTEYQYSYFNGSVGYAMAYALYTGFRKIILFGCDYMYDHKPGLYERGRGCVEFWIAVGTERGADIQVAKSSTLMDSNNPRLYGYRENPEFDVKKGADGKTLLTFKGWKPNDKPDQNLNENVQRGGRHVPEHGESVHVRPDNPVDSD